jgi:hypothetical protein
VLRRPATSFASPPAFARALLTGRGRAIAPPEPSRDSRTPRRMGHSRSAASSRAGNLAG